MDYFDKQFGKYGASEQSDLPEGFGWEDMKDDIYERMEEERPAANYKKYWPFLLLLLFVGCGTGSWFALNQKNKNEMGETVSNEKLNPSTSEQIDLSNNTNGNQISDNAIDLVPNESARAEDDIDLKNNDNNKITFASDDANLRVKTREQKIVSTEDQSNKTAKENNITSVKRESGEVNSNVFNLRKGILAFGSQSDQLKLVDTEPHRPLPTKLTTSEVDSVDDFSTSVVLKENRTTELQSLVFEGFANQKLPVDATIAEVQKSKRAIKVPLVFSLSSGVANWVALSNNNINKDHISAYPGYAINSSVQLFIRPKHALQLDYEFTAVEELFDYDGSKSVTISHENVIVEELISSLTGKVISTERKNITVPGTRTTREVKYNAYQFHTLSLGYHFATAKKKRSSYGFYLGGSYLFKMIQQGKRLTEALDVVSFDNENSIFTDQQFGLRFGLNYDFSIGKKTALFSQLVATQYLTNWEVGSSNAKTRPLFYGLQIGVRRAL